MTDDTKRKNSLLEILLKEYSIKDIITIFSSIDDKIMSLHECSSQDFLNFNAHLKVYYKQAKTISENAQIIFDIIAGKDSRVIFNEFNAFHEKLKVHVDYFEKELTFSISTLSKILTNLNFMFVPLKNFSQNLMTLKFLFANLKLNMSSPGTIGSEDEDSEINRIERLIVEIKSGYPRIDEELNMLKLSIKETLLKLETINKRKENNVETILNQIHSNINYLSARHEDALLLIPKMSQKTEHCFTSISKIITNLQYQDIIRQKMQNLQETYKELIKELNLLEENEIEKIILFKQAKYAGQIPYIAELQIAQLLQTNKEYQNAIQIITTKFLDIAEDMTTVASMCQQIASHTHQSEETHFDQIRNKLSDASELIEQFTTTNSEFTLEIENIRDAIEKMANNFNNILELDNKLQAISLKAISEATSDHKINELSKISQQIKTLTGDIRLNMSKSQYLFEQTQVLIRELHSSFSGENDIEQNTENLVDNVNKILKTIDDENQKVIAKLDDNKNLSQTISTEIKKSVEQVQYYDFFEKIIEEIIIDLNNIYHKLEFESTDAAKAAKANDLKSIEEFYTTKSERFVHKTVVGDEEDEIFDNEENKDEDEIEFF